MLESITRHLVRIAWYELAQDDSRLSIGEIKTCKVHVKEDYVRGLKDKEVREYILENLNDHYYRTQVDVHVFVDNRFVLGIKCKAYVEKNTGGLYALETCPQESCLLLDSVGKSIRRRLFQSVVKSTIRQLKLPYFDVVF